MAKQDLPMSFSPAFLFLGGGKSRISQQLGPKSETWNTNSPSYLTRTTSPIWKLLATANSSQPLVSLRQVIFTFQLMSEVSDFSSAVVFPKLFPSTYFEKKSIGIVYNKEQHKIKVKKQKNINGKADRKRNREKER